MQAKAVAKLMVSKTQRIVMNLHRCKKLATDGPVSLQDCSGSRVVRGLGATEAQPIVSTIVTVEH